MARTYSLGVRMNRQALQKLSTERRRDASALLKAGCSAGGYYLMGYAVECALKACVAKQVKRYDFPDRALAQKAFTHNLEVLVGLAGLEQDLQRDMRANPPLEVNWATVKDWSESKRYELGITNVEAKDLYSACNARKHGILIWIRKRW